VSEALDASGYERLATFGEPASVVRARMVQHFHNHIGEARAEVMRMLTSEAGMAEAVAAVYVERLASRLVSQRVDMLLPAVMQRLADAAPRD